MITIAVFGISFFSFTLVWGKHHLPLAQYRMLWAVVAITVFVIGFHIAL